jgi:uncharacterized protein YeaO (DUF488 family)
MAEHELRVRRVYEETWVGDGARVLVDRIWPRDLTLLTAPRDPEISQAAVLAELLLQTRQD